MWKIGTRVKKVRPARNDNTIPIGSEGVIIDYMPERIQLVMVYLGLFPTKYIVRYSMGIEGGGSEEWLEPIRDDKDATEYFTELKNKFPNLFDVPETV